MNSEKLIFLSYASEDRDRVEPFYEKLMSKGYNVWMDCKCLVGGQDWNFEIRRTLNKSSMILIFLSQHSLTKRGYIQREIKIALDKVEEQLASDIFVIPIMLDDDAEIPDLLKKQQAIFAKSETILADLDRAIQHQLFENTNSPTAMVPNSDIFALRRTINEKYDGIPGYIFEAFYYSLNSESNDKISDACDIVLGDLKSSLCKLRESILDQDPSFYNFGQDSYRRTHTSSFYSHAPRMTGRILSIVFAHHWYGAGAAHPNYGFLTYNFFFKPLFRILSIAEIFAPDHKFEDFQKVVRGHLQLEMRQRRETEDFELDEWAIRGTEKIEDFECFAFGDGALEVYFAPYHVGCYAEGGYVIRIPLGEVLHMVKEPYRSALK